MRITIVQVEIETAIEQYVRSQVDIKDGQEISIDFKATRGEDGATADINIGPSKASAGIPAKNVPVKRAAAVVKQVNEQQTEEEYTQVKQEAIAATKAQEGLAEQINTSAASAPVEEVEAPETQAEETAKPATGSLFAQMRRPVNS